MHMVHWILGKTRAWGIAFSNRALLGQAPFMRAWGIDVLCTFTCIIGGFFLDCGLECTDTCANTPNQYGKHYT